MSVYDLTPTEIYHTYVEGADPDALVDQGREDIAARLQVDHKLKQEEAFYAADQILAYAYLLIEGRGNRAQGGSEMTGQTG